LRKFSYFFLKKTLTHKISGFHINEKFGEAIPDSALLIGVGLALGFILNLFKVSHNAFYLPSDVFFLFLLPPIIFDAGLLVFWVLGEFNKRDF
jgi:hypothetical protein